MIKYVVHGRLPGLNKLIDANRTNKYLGAKMKKDAQDTVSWAVRAVGVRKAPKPCNITFRWYEPDRRRDKDNISSARKYILDSFVEMGVLENDGWADIEGFRDYFYIDKENPRIEIEISE